MSEQLIPCPFCGGDETRLSEDAYSNRAVFCMDCGASGPLARMPLEGGDFAAAVRAHRDVEAEAVRLWNTRDPRAAARGLRAVNSEAQQEHVRAMGRQHGAENGRKFGGRKRKDGTNQRRTRPEPESEAQP